MSGICLGVLKNITSSKQIRAKGPITTRVILHWKKKNKKKKKKKKKKLYQNIKINAWVFDLR